MRTTSPADDKKNPRLPSPATTEHVLSSYREASSLKGVGFSRDRLGKAAMAIGVLKLQIPRPQRFSGRSRPLVLTVLLRVGLQYVELAGAKLGM